jgi:hypothetical protein
LRSLKLSETVSKNYKGKNVGNLDATLISANNEKEKNAEKKNNSIIDKLFFSFGSDVEKLRKYGKNVSIENEQNEYNINKIIDKFIRNIENDNFAASELSSLNYELVEKSLLDKLKSENEELAYEINSLEEKINDINKFNFKIVSEENFLRHSIKDIEKKSKDLFPKTNNINEELQNKKILSKQLKNVLSNEKIKINNLNTVIRTLLKQIDNEICDEFDELVIKYGNSDFIDRKKYISDNNTIEELLGKIHKLEKEKFEKETAYKTFLKNKNENIFNANKNNK